jgi:3-deoxy-manno-octulosonate cytidylyltransferase (CMP-KDO synthetase)
MPIKIAAVIPARFGSTRFKGKPLIKIAGIPMIERVYRRVEKVDRFANIIVATDDERIEAVVENFGGEVVLTSPNIESGTERVWAAVKGKNFDAIVNVQGDEPLIDIDLLAALADGLANDDKVVISAAFRNSSYRDFLSPHCVKVALDSHKRALYFSRAPIPYSTKPLFDGFFHHIGIYGYRIDALNRFVGWQKSRLEEFENLEQLRFLEHGITIQIITTSNRSLGVDVPEDVKKIETILSKENEKD